MCESHKNHNWLHTILVHILFNSNDHTVHMYKQFCSCVPKHFWWWLIYLSVKVAVLTWSMQHFKLHPVRVTMDKINIHHKVHKSRPRKSTAVL